MDSRHVEKGQKLASKSSSSHEDLEELSSVVDGKIVSDDHSLPKSAGEPKVTLNTIVMAIVVVGIILFASFQITECVSAHENPGTKSKVADVNRTFPGLMFCPFGRNAAGSNQCPIWSPDAYLSFDFSGPSIFGPDKDPIHFYNTNVDTASRKKRPNSCSLNQINYLEPSQLWFAASTHPTIRSPRSAAFFKRLVTIKNSAMPARISSTQTTPERSCNSWTPPNVQCLVFDPSTFDEATKTFPELNPDCNPMREAKANSVDSLAIKAKFDTDPLGGVDFFGNVDRSRWFGGYTYSGLIQQTTNPGDFFPNPFATAPSRLSLYTQELVQQGYNQPCRSNVNMSLFGGVVAVLYDVSKGIPTELNFDGARTNTMSSDVLGSTVLLSTIVKNPAPPGENRPINCEQLRAPSLSCTVTEQRDVVFTNAVTNKMETKSRQVAQFLPPVINANTDETIASGRFGSPDEQQDFSLPVLSISFSSSSTIISTELIGLSVLTTLSIIVSTAATLWNAQQKIQDGIILVTDNVKEFLHKRRAATKSSPAALS